MDGSYDPIWVERLREMEKEKNLWKARYYRLRKKFERKP